MIALRRERHPPPAGARIGGRPVYAIGDVHGRYDLLRALLAAIADDAAGRTPGARPLLILCGDYVDRGPDSRRVLEALTWLAHAPAIEARLLEGNHEAVLKLFLDAPEEHGQWLDFGGRETLASYGVAAPEEIAPEDLTRLRDQLLEAMPAAHYLLLRRLELMVRVGDYTFVHAGVRPRVALDRQKRDDLLWIREAFLDHPRPATGVVVHGHTWVDDRPDIAPHRIGLDTGAYETGVLTALRIGDDELEVLQVVGAAASPAGASLAER